MQGAEASEASGDEELVAVQGMWEGVASSSVREGRVARLANREAHDQPLPARRDMYAAARVNGARAVTLDCVAEKCEV